MSSGDDEQKENSATEQDASAFSFEPAANTSHMESREPRRPHMKTRHPVRALDVCRRRVRPGVARRRWEEAHPTQPTSTGAPSLPNEARPAPDYITGQSLTGHYVGFACAALGV